MRDYTSDNYCDFLWVRDLQKLKKDANNVFSLEVKKGEKKSKITVNYVTVFGTIVEVKQIKSQEFLYQLDDGTGVICCKHSEDQFEEIINLIENENVDILSQTLKTQSNFERSSVFEVSSEDSVFNDKSIQIEDVNFNKKCRLKGLQSIWDDIYKSFSSLMEPYKIGDSVIIQGKLYTYFNINQIYVNNIRTVDVTEEIMLLTIKLDNSDEPEEVENFKGKSDSEKRFSGLMTFDNVMHLNTKSANSRNIKTPELSDDLLKRIPKVVTPNLKPTITFDTFYE